MQKGPTREICEPGILNFYESSYEMVHFSLHVYVWEQLGNFKLLHQRAYRYEYLFRPATNDVTAKNSKRGIHHYGSQVQ